MNRILRHPAVRDLAAVMGAPGMLDPACAPGRGTVIPDAECEKLLETHWGRLEELDRDPAPLLQWLECAPGGSKLLGRYFEALLGFWIARVLGSRRSEHSIPVLRDRQVVGELDFVFEDPSGVLRHWEAAVKFYLCTAESEEGGSRADAFLGTMTRDRLDKKLRKLFGQQLRMPRTPEGEAALRAAGFAPGAIQSRLFMKGALFYPAEGDWRRRPHPPEVSAGHQRGWWGRWLPAESEPDARWVVLDRRRWLSPFWAEPGYAPFSREQLLREIQAHFADARTAFMVAETVRDDDGCWRETSRGLVVHPGWPWPVSGE